MPTAQQIDHNGFITIPKNPISRAGVFQYSGRSLPDADPNKIYNVYRPAEELAHPDALESFKNMPLINEHEMLGEGYDTAPEEKGIDGWTGENVVFEDGVLYSPLRLVTDKIKNEVMNGNKKGLSMGYRCVFTKSSGVFNGNPYDYIQTNLRGNHIALVTEGRSGKDIAVLDSFAFDHFDIVLKGDNLMTIEELGQKMAAMDESIKSLSAKVAAMDADEDKEDDKKKAEDADEDKKDDKKAEDADEDKEEDKKKAMDVAINAAVDAKIKSLGLKPHVAMDAKQLFAEVSKRDEIAAKVSEIVGVFDHKDKTTAEVVSYAMDKLELKAPAGHEEAVLMGYLAGRKATAPVATYALDGFKVSGKDDLLMKQIQKVQG